MITNRISTFVAATLTLFAVACSGTDVDDGTDTSKGKGALQGGETNPTGSSGASGSVESGTGCVPPGSPVLPPPTDAGPIGTEPRPDDTGLVLCNPSECPQQIPAMAAICPDGSVANLECLSFTKPNEPKKCNWEPVCGL